MEVIILSQLWYFAKATYMYKCDPHYPILFFGRLQKKVANPCCTQLFCLRDQVLHNYCAKPSLVSIDMVSHYYPQSLGGMFLNSINTNDSVKHMLEIYELAIWQCILSVSKDTFRLQMIVQMFKSASKYSYIALNGCEELIQIISGSECLKVTQNKLEKLAIPLQY